MLSLQDYPPPALYDHPYTGPGLDMITQRSEAICRAMGVTAIVIYGCSMWVGGGCLIILPKVVAGSITQLDQDEVRRMENANCNGWPRGNRQ